MGPILHRTAHLHGITPDQLRSNRWIHPVAGVSLPREDAEHLNHVCAAAALVLPGDAVFTHLTSAVLRGWWLPRIHPLPIIACTWGEAPHHDRRGVYVRRCELPGEHRQSRFGLSVASAEWTIVELAEHLSLVDLVVVIDGALHRGDTTIERLRATMRKGRRGVRVLRRALELADGRSESPWETVLRLLHVVAGFPVQPQYEVRDEDGDIVYRLDLLIRGTRHAPEFDGSVHREREVHRRDLRREKLLARERIERFGYCSPEVIDEPQTIVRDAENALGLSHDPSRLKFWLPMIEASSFDRRGYVDLLRRLRRFTRNESPRASSGASRATSGATSGIRGLSDPETAPLAVTPGDG